MAKEFEVGDLQEECQELKILGAAIACWSGGKLHRVYTPGAD